MARIFSDYIEAQGLLFKHARGVSDRSGKEFHAFHEIIYFLGGEAEFISEKLHMPLQPETLIVIPKETYHQLVVLGDQQSYYRCLLQVSSHDLPEGILAIRGDREIAYLFGKLMSAAEARDPEAPQLLCAVSTLLLNALKDKQPVTDGTYAQNPLVRQALHYINQNLDKPLSLPEIAKACSVSLSTLSHVFKAEMNLSLHQFIIKKRLISAVHKISAGQSAAAAALECGFCDYSAFYRQYKQHFGTSPGQKSPSKTF